MKKRSLITILNLILLFSLVTFSQAEEYEYVTKWITQVDGHNIHPTGMTTDKEGFVYVAGGGKIAKYTSDGTLVLKIENIPNSDDFYFSSWQQHVAVDNSGNIYVSSWDDGMVFKFDSQGDYSGTKWDSWSGGSDRFNGPQGIAVDDSGNVYVCDYHNCRIVKFDPDGGYLATVASQGGNDGEVQNPEDLAFDASGNIYVADSGNNRIQVLDPSGTFLRKWGSWGTGDGQFKWIQGIAVDFNDNVYTVDPNLLRVTKFASDGTFILKWGGWGDDNYHFDYPYAIAVDYSGNLYVGDHNNQRVLKYKLVGAPTVEITNPAQDEFVKGTVSLQANVTVPDGYTISNVEFFRDDTKLGEIAASPYSYDWDTFSAGGNGPYTIWVVATNTEGAKTKEKVSVIVANDDTAPTNSITNPSDQDEIRDTVSIQASTSDDNGIAKVEFYINGTKVGEDTDNTDSTYEYSWDTKTVDDGEKELKVIAYDTIGQFFSDTITVTVENQEEFIYIDKWYTDNPTDVTLDSAGNLYVSGNHRIKKYAPDGTYISQIEQTGDFNLDWNFYIAIDNSGNIYASNQDNHNIVKFDSDGNYVTKWGSFGAAEDQFHSPRHIACDSTGNVYVCDFHNNRISKFDSDGTFISSWGTSGGSNGQFSNPEGIAVDNSDNIYVADRHNNRIQVFTSNGTFVTKWGSWGDGDNQFNCPNAIAFDSLGNIYITEDGYHRVTKFSSDGTFITKWGSWGSGDLQFRSPYGIAVDSNFYVYVADRDNYRVVKFKSTWLPTTEITNPANNSILETSPVIIQVAASSGIGIDKVEFYMNGSKVGEDTDNTDSTYEYIWDTSLELDGAYTIKAIAYNTRNTSLESEEISVVVNNSGDELPSVSITNPAEGDIIRLTTNITAEATDPEQGGTGGISKVEFYVDGTKFKEDTVWPFILLTWDATTVEDGERVIKVIAYDTIGQNVEDSITVTVINHEEFGYVSKWSGDSSSDVAVGKNGYIYVAGNSKIKKYTPDGTLVSKIEYTGNEEFYLDGWFHIAVDADGNIYASDNDNHNIIKFDSNGNYVTKWGSWGYGDYQFYNPHGIATDSEGNVYICDHSNNRIVKYDSEGTLLTEWGTQGGSDGQFNNPHGIALDSSDNIYVIDRYNNRIQVFSSDGTFIRKWGSHGYENNQLRNPRGITIDNENNVYIVDGENYRVVKYTSNGTFLAKWGSRGSENLQFECMNGIAVDSNFNVWLCPKVTGNIKSMHRKLSI